MKYHLRIEEHEEFGIPGISIITPNRRDYHGPAIGGSNLAHDIIEHSVKAHPDPFIDELLALGGILAGRVENGEFLLRELTYVIEGMLEYKPDSFMENSQYPNNKKLKDRKLYQSVLSVVDAVDPYIDDDEIVPFNKQLVTAWICEGYQRFRNRFRRYDLYDISNHLFSTIEKVADKWLNHAEIGDEADLFVQFRGYYVDLVVDG